MRIYEVGPRDGIQSLTHHVPKEQKVRLIRLLCEGGLTDIEIGSFVHPNLVPNMADSDEVFAETAYLKCNLAALVPNRKGIDRAKSAGVTKFNIFFSPSDTFNRANFNQTYDEIVGHYTEALQDIDREDVRVYLSMAFACPLENLEVAVVDALKFGKTVVLSDTDGLASPSDVFRAVRMVMPHHTVDLSLHLHQGRFLFDNIRIAYDLGVREFDSSIGGLGGCPFIKGSGANLATEDLVMWCNENDIDCGIDYDSLKPAIDCATLIRIPNRRASLRHHIRKAKAVLRGAINR